MLLAGKFYELEDLLAAHGASARCFPSPLMGEGGRRPGEGVPEPSAVNRNFVSSEEEQKRASLRSRALSCPLGILSHKGRGEKTNRLPGD